MTAYPDLSQQPDRFFLPPLLACVAIGPHALLNPTVLQFTSTKRSVSILTLARVCFFLLSYISIHSPDARELGSPLTKVHSSAGTPHRHARPLESHHIDGF